MLKQSMSLYLLFRTYYWPVFQLCQYYRVNKPERPTSQGTRLVHQIGPPPELCVLPRRGLEGQVEAPQASHWFPTSLVEGQCQVSFMFPSGVALFPTKAKERQRISINLFLNGPKQPATFPAQCWGLAAQGGSAFTCLWDSTKQTSLEGNKCEIEYQQKI